MTSETFGVTVSCYRGDLPLLRGCLESIRTHLGPDMPICLIVDGEMPVSQFVKAYGVQTLSKSDVDPRLRANSYGYGCTKMIAFWHSPFDVFLHIDADTVCWGNFIEDLPWPDFDLIFSEPHETITDHIQKSQYFDPDLIFDTYSKFPWQGLPYFNTGVFAARRGILDLEEYLELLAFQRANPAALLCGEQGILNLMVFRRIAEGRIRARQWPFQAVVPVLSEQELATRFAFENGKPVIRKDDQRLIHWAGPKPFISRRGPTFPKPMTYYRVKHMDRTRAPLRHFGSLALTLDEWMSRLALAKRGGLHHAITSKIIPRRAAVKSKH